MHKDILIIRQKNEDVNVDNLSTIKKATSISELIPPQFCFLFSGCQPPKEAVNWCSESTFLVLQYCLNQILNMELCDLCASQT